MQWVVICRDKPGMEDARQQTRADHRAYIWRDDLPATMLTGAPLSDDTGNRMLGTWLVLEAPDRDAVDRFLRGDPYTKLDMFQSVDVFPVFKGYDPSVILPPAHKRGGRA